MTTLIVWTTLLLAALHPCVLGDEVKLRPKWDGSKFGYVAQGRGQQFVIPARFGLAGVFSEGLAGVKLGTQHGFIDRQGRFVIGPQSTWILPGRFSEGLAAVRISLKYGYIDKEGSIVIRPSYDHALTFSEGLAAASVEGRYGYIDKQGNWTIRPKFHSAGWFENGEADVTIDDKHGRIDREGNYTVTPVFPPYAAYTYWMSLVFHFEESADVPRACWTFTVRHKGANTELESVDDLKKHLGTLPRGSVLVWAPGCDTDGTEPLVNSETEMARFRDFCTERGITLKMIPSG